MSATPAWKESAKQNHIKQVMEKQEECVALRFVLKQSHSVKNLLCTSFQRTQTQYKHICLLTYINGFFKRNHNPGRKWAMPVTNALGNYRPEHLVHVHASLVKHMHRHIQQQAWIIQIIRFREHKTLSCHPSWHPSCERCLLCSLLDITRRHTQRVPLVTSLLLFACDELPLPPTNHSAWIERESHCPCRHPSSVVDNNSEYFRS